MEEKLNSTSTSNEKGHNQLIKMASRFVIVADLP